MKKIVLVFLMCTTLVLSLTAQQVVVTGLYKSDNAPRQMRLFEVISGRIEEFAITNLMPDGSFGFAFTPKQGGFYAIGKDQAFRALAYSFYFKPGDRLNLEINDTSYVLVDQNSKENKLMEQWHNYICPVETMARKFSGNITYVEFFPELQEKLKGMAVFSKLSSGNPTFDKAFRDFVKVDMMYNALNFVFTPRTAHPEGEDYPDYYNQIDIQEITSNDALIDYPYGTRLLEMALIKKHLDSGVKRAPLLDDQLAIVQNPVLKGEWVVDELLRTQSYAQFAETENKYGKLLLTADQKERVDKHMTTLANYKPGSPGFDFSFPDTEGKNVSMSDFKGKLVFVDTWATWCGPCRKEFPHLKELEEKYKNKDIVFVGISVDKPTDAQKWKDFVKKEDLRGVQLHAGNDNPFTKFYKISTIPRFLLFDRNGNILTTDAPKPSDGDKLTTLLDSVLQK